jgi:hypothetical protein
MAKSKYAEAVDNIQVALRPLLKYNGVGGIDEWLGEDVHDGGAF